VRDRYRRLTYAQLVAAADQLAASLAGQGMRPGERVAVWRPAQVAAAYAEIFELYQRGKIKPAATTVFPLERAGEALAGVRDRRIAGRAVLHLRDD